MPRFLFSESSVLQLHSSSWPKSVDCRCHAKGIVFPLELVWGQSYKQTSAQPLFLPFLSSHLFFRLLINPSWTWELPGSQGAVSFSLGPDEAHFPESAFSQIYAWVVHGEAVPSLLDFWGIPTGGPGGCHTHSNHFPNNDPLTNANEAVLYLLTVFPFSLW